MNHYLRYYNIRLGRKSASEYIEHYIYKLQDILGELLCDQHFQFDSYIAKLVGKIADFADALRRQEEKEMGRIIHCPELSENSLKEILESCLCNASESSKIHDFVNFLMKNHEKLVFVGGNYDLMSNLRSITKAVTEENFIPVLPYDYGVSKQEIREMDMIILTMSKYAIFEGSKLGGWQNEIERAYMEKDRGNILLLYQARSNLDREPPPELTRMIEQMDGISIESYVSIEELFEIVRRFLRAKVAKIVFLS
jgi:hypothetical protein